MATINTRFYIYSTKSPILTSSYEFVKRMLQKIAGIDNLPVLGCFTGDINRELGRVTQDVKKYPYINVTPVQIQQDTDTYNHYSMKKYGQNPIKAADGYWYTFHIRPCILSFTATFYTQDFSQALDFMANWHYNAREASFKLQTVEGFEIAIKVDIDPTASFPNREFSNGDPLKVEVSFDLHTYTGAVYKTASISKIKVDQEVVSEMGIVNFEKIFEDADQEENLN